MNRAIAVLALWLGFAAAALAAQPWERLPYPAPTPKPVRAGYAPVNGVQLWYAEYGSGPPLILLHGGLGNSSYWGSRLPPSPTTIASSPSTAAVTAARHATLKPTAMI